MPESDMQPSPIADTVMPEEPSTRVGSFSTLLMFCHLTEFLTPPALASYHIATEKFGPGQRGATSAHEHRLRSASYSDRRWLWSERCQHHAPLACAVAVILWGRIPQATKRRAGARCTSCGGKGATSGQAGPAIISVSIRTRPATLTCSPASECVSAARTRSCGPNSLDSNILVLCKPISRRVIIYRPRYRLRRNRMRSVIAGRNGRCCVNLGCRIDGRRCVDRRCVDSRWCVNRGGIDGWCGVQGCRRLISWGSVAVARRHQISGQCASR